jgi:hypothetical protein
MPSRSISGAAGNERRPQARSAAMIEGRLEKFWFHGGRRVRSAAATVVSKVKPAPGSIIRDALKYDSELFRHL